MVLPDFIKLLSHEIRWQMVKALTLSDYRVNELVGIVDHPMNLVSYHLKLLRDAGIVTIRRSEADGRDTYYSLNLNRLRDLYLQVGKALYSSLLTNVETPLSPTNNKLRILFVCTHNSARSQMAEALSRKISKGRIDVFSAGSDPTPVHPETIRTLDAFGIDIRAQQSKSLDEFSQQSFDYVITVCDLAREVCPTFAGDGQQIHWGFPDPLLIQDDNLRQQAFVETANRLKTRIEYFLIELAQEA